NGPDELSHSTPPSSSGARTRWRLSSSWTLSPTPRGGATRPRPPRTEYASRPAARTPAPARATRRSGDDGRVGGSRALGIPRTLRGRCRDPGGRRPAEGPRTLGGTWRYSTAGRQARNTRFVPRRRPCSLGRRPAARDSVALTLRLPPPTVDTRSAGLAS